MRNKWYDEAIGKIIKEEPVMKRKYQILILTLMLFFALGGCGNKNTAELVSQDTVWLYDDREKSVIMINQGEKPKVIYTEENDENDFGDICIDNGVFYRMRDEENEGSRKYEISKLNQYGEWETITSGDRNMTDEEAFYMGRAFDVYDGKVYRLEIESDENWKVSAYRETVYEQSSDGIREVESDNQPLYDKMALEGYELLRGIKKENGGTEGTYTIPYCLHTFGKVMGWNDQDNRIAVYDKAGNREAEFALQGENPYIRALTGDFLIYSVYEDDTVKLYAYDIIKQENRLLTEASYDEQWDIRDIEENAIFYAISQEIEYRVEKRSYYHYDLISGETSLIYDSVSQPGMDWYYAPGQTFQVVDGICYFTDFDGKEMVWYLAYREDGKWVNKPLGLTEKHYSFADFGTIEYESRSVRCPLCEKDIYGIYIEQFYLNSDYPNAEVINEKLRREAEECFAQIPDEETLAADHEWHFDTYRETYENTVSDVQKIGTHYLEICYSGYSYSGGAHGYPDRGYKVIDLDTGKEVGFGDFYKGTLEAFKETVAEYTVADWKEEPDQYFASSEEDLYREVYEYAAYDNLIKFTDSGIEIQYSPYHLGPYAAGFITIEIPYDALGISITDL